MKVNLKFDKEQFIEDLNVVMINMIGDYIKVEEIEEVEEEITEEQATLMARFDMTLEEAKSFKKLKDCGIMTPKNDYEEKSSIIENFYKGRNIDVNEFAKELEFFRKTVHEVSK